MSLSQHNMDCVKESKNPNDFFVSEIESHEAQGAQWWDMTGSMRPLHSMNKLRIPLIKRGLLATKCIDDLQAEKQNFLKGLKILDVGCGGGILCEALAKAGGTVTGLDPSEGLTTLARCHAVALDVPPPHYVCDTVESHAAHFPCHYDVVVASEVIEHVPNKDSFLTACVAALKPGGSLFVTTPNRTCGSWLGLFVCENVLRMVPIGFHSWSQFIHHSDLVAMIHKLGCNVAKVRGMFYDPFRNKWSWWFTPNFLYAIHAVKSS